MRRAAVPLAALLALLAPRALRADAFDNYTNPILAKVAGAPGVLKLQKAAPAVLAEHAGVLPGTTAALLVVRTNEGRWGKLLVQPARQKVPGGGSVPILLIDRFVTFREGEERTVLAKGQNVRLFGGFAFNLDLGQVVPDKVGADLRFVAGPDRNYLEPVGKAELYLLTKELPEAAPKKAGKLVIGAAFEPRYFNGAYQLYDDGRRSGKLHLKVAPNGDVSGYYYSDKDGRKYEVEGKVGTPAHSIRFRITFPRTVQDFHGWLFTGDGRALTGYSRLQDRETGFYALRQE
jgi:hypothetical protein